jgi:serine protease Do
MKNSWIAFGMFTLSLLPGLGFAQDTPAEGKPGKKESQEIIIRQKGNKDMNLKVEINGENITVNGKPLSEFMDKDVTINKRRMIITDGDKKMMWDFNRDNQDWGRLGENFGEDFMREFEIEVEGVNSNKAFLGVTTEKNEKGAAIEEVVNGSAAEKAGLKKGDIITRIGEEAVAGPEELSDLIGFRKPGDEIKISYLREGKKSTAKATLGKRAGRTQNMRAPRPQIRAFTMPHMGAPEVNMEGFEGQGEMPGFTFTLGKGKKIGLKLQDTEEGNGVRVINVEDSSAAATAGIRKDDLITEINGRKIENTDDAREELVPEPDKKSYKITVNRGGSIQTFEVKIPKKLKTANF